MTAREALREIIREAAQALADKLDAITESDEYQRVFIAAHNARDPYRGPTWVAELSAVRTALTNRR